MDEIIDLMNRCAFDGPQSGPAADEDNWFDEMGEAQKEQYGRAWDADSYNDARDMED